jgi:uncharacterized protein with FMN-binding domain
VSGIVLLLTLKSAVEPAAGGVAGQSTPAPGVSREAAGATGTGERTVTGDVTPTRYGNVQVRLTMTDGRIVRAEAVQAPQGGLSGRKTALAVPRLGEQAVAAQGADIDTVSGATYTSDGYRRSLQSALDRADD